MKKYINFSIILIMFTSCKDDSVVDSVGKDIFEKVNAIPYELNKIEFEDLPYTIWRLAEPEKNPNPVDSNGIEVFIWGGKTHYHPLHLCQRMDWYLDSYYQSKNPYYLEWIKKYHSKLMELGIEKEDVLYFPYDFDFALHGYNWDVMKAPWLSAMTQGIALMVHSS